MKPSQRHDLKKLYTSDLLDGPKLQTLNDLLHYGLSKMEIVCMSRDGCSSAGKVASDRDCVFEWRWI